MTLRILAVLLASLAFAPAALADIPPPKDYVEQCTPEKACAKGEESSSCGGYFREKDKCKNELAKDGWVYKCKTRGATAWTEVWCRAKKAEPKK